MPQKTKAIQKQIKQAIREKQLTNSHSITLKPFLQINQSKVKGQQGVYYVKNIIYDRAPQKGFIAELQLKNKTKYVGKFIKLSKQIQAITEIYYLHLMRSEHICNLIEIKKTNNGIWIIVEKGWKDLSEYQPKQNQILTILKNIAIAYTNFYLKGIAHRDLKLKNLIIEQDLKIKIIDLELCEKDNQVYGTIDHIPPQIKAIRWSTSDVFAYGTLAQRICQKCGFENQQITMLIDGCLNQNVQYRWDWSQIFYYWGININREQNQN